jgi:2-hydroxy-3-keto-5-methylthiopentenyl-1-phosphate phosphatase
MKAKPLAVFCDFDGTITERDMIITICEKFCPPGWERVKEAVLSRRQSVREGVAELFAMIPSSKKNEIIAFAQSVVRYRQGFEEFLQFCKENGLLFIVCSGGVDFFVEPLLAAYRSSIHKIYSMPADFSTPTITLQHPYGCDICGTCKVKVMAEYPETIKILIGDGVTDIHGAHHANVVFARNGLQKYLDEDKVAYFPFETFYDVIDKLKTFRGHPHEESAART